MTGTFKATARNYTSSHGHNMTAWSTPIGGVMLDNDTNEITVMSGHDCMFGTDCLVVALNEIGFDWSEE